MKNVFFTLGRTLFFCVCVCSSFVIGSPVPRCVYVAEWMSGGSSLSLLFTVSFSFLLPFSLRLFFRCIRNTCVPDYPNSYPVVLPKQWSWLSLKAFEGFPHPDCWKFLVRIHSTRLNSPFLYQTAFAPERRRLANLNQLCGRKLSFTRMIGWKGAVDREDDDLIS